MRRRKVVWTQSFRSAGIEIKSCNVRTTASRTEVMVCRKKGKRIGASSVIGRLDSDISIYGMEKRRYVRLRFVRQEIGDFWEGN